MKLHFYQFDDGVENFGDNLNDWLWQRLLDGYLDDDDRSMFFGIGTILNDQNVEKTASAKQRVVFSSGVGYGDRPPKLDESWRVYCVRGPLSARALGLPESAAVTDGAMLLALVDRPVRPKRWQYSFMPHVEDMAEHAWHKICRATGYNFIDPRWSTERVLDAICETEVLITEAMHGAIAADALRVPWIPVTTSNRVLPFKWLDWCSTVGVNYQPHRITTQVIACKKQDLLTPLRLGKYWAQRQAAQVQFNRLKKARPELSADSVHSRVVSELVVRLDQFKADVDAGMFRSPN